MNPQRTVRVSDPLWDAVKAKAAARGETVTDVVVRALEQYMDDDAPAIVEQWVAYVGDEVVASGQGRLLRFGIPPQSVRVEITRGPRPQPFPPS